jgi:DNA-binding transcriptional LysR family regulator
MHQIRYFLALAETLNLTRAAERCNVAQPALTRAIKALEGELGGELLRRERALSHLTELGRRILPMLRQCYQTALAAKTVAASIGKARPHLSR